MSKKTLKIDNKTVKAEAGQTILEVTKDSNIPSLCYHSDLKAKASCRLCVVEVNGKIVTACSTKIENGMKVITNSKEIRALRKTNLELIFAQHKEECSDCIYNFNCQLLKLAKEYKVDVDRFRDRKESFPLFKMGPSLEFDSSKCIDCKNCVEVCKNQGVEHLKIEEENGFFQVKETKNPCIYCGQCIVHCPVGALEAVGEFEDVEKALKKDFVIFQFAPSIRTSIGEEFGFKKGEILTEQLTAGIKKLGAKKVFDVSVGADITTVLEAEELMKRLESKKNLPMFTSCCPAWVRFIECYFPEFIPNLTTVRSPHMIMGGLIKKYYPKAKVVSVMPCVAKKYEIKRKEFKDNPVDYVLTTRELAYLFHKYKINLRKIKPRKPDNPFGLPSGAGVIYGASGGVMESALRTSIMKMTGKKLPKLVFKDKNGIRETEVNGLKVAVINGTGKAKQFLKGNFKEYDYVEVMACPGGCIGGGGQPVPVNQEIREKRAQGLHNIDKTKKIRLAHENPIVKKVLKDNIHSLTHTTYDKRNCSQ